jgi:hypothetical protein
MLGTSLSLLQVAVAPDAAEYAQHLVGEPVEPVNGKAEDPLRFRVLRPGLRLRCLPRLLWLRCLPRLPRLAGRPGIGVAVHREAQDPVSLFPVAGHGSTF